MFVTTVVAGTVSVLGSFEIAQVSFLRDAIFLVGASYWTFYILYTGNIWTAEAIGKIDCYNVYHDSLWLFVQTPLIKLHLNKNCMFFFN